MKEFTWKITHVEHSQGTMLVEYTHNGKATVYNVPMPPSGEDVGAWVKVYAPVSEWQRLEAQFAPVDVGMEGTHTIMPPASPTGGSPADLPTLNGSLNEEYIRAVVYSVLEEMREGQV